MVVNVDGKQAAEPFDVGALETVALEDDGGIKVGEINRAGTGDSQRRAASDR